MTPLHQAQWLREFMPHADLVVLDNVGHIPQVEDPTLFNDSLIRALTAPAPGTG